MECQTSASQLSSEARNNLSVIFGMDKNGGDATSSSYHSNNHIDDDDDDCYFCNVL